MTSSPAALRLDAAAARLGVAALLASLFAATPPAGAESIQKCRIDGQWVLQGGPCPLEAPPAARMTAPPPPPPSGSGAPHKKTLAEVLRARDGNDPPPVREVSSDGALVLRNRMGAM